MCWVFWGGKGGCTSNVIENISTSLQALHNVKTMQKSTLKKTPQSAIAGFSSRKNNGRIEFNTNLTYVRTPICVIFYFIKRQYFK